MKKKQKKAKKIVFKSFRLRPETVEHLEKKKGGGKSWDRFFSEL